MKMCISFQFPIPRGKLIIFMCKNHLYITQNKIAVCSFLQTKANNDKITLPTQKKHTKTIPNKQNKKKPNKLHTCTTELSYVWTYIPGKNLCSWEFVSEVLDLWTFILIKKKKKKSLEIHSLFLQSRPYLI